MISFVLAVSENYGIGLNNSLPWGHLKGDMAWFRECTMGKPIVMGSSTWDSLPRKPLPGRTNVVLTTRGAIGGATVMSGDSSEIVHHLKAEFGDQEICIIGGAKVYDAMWPFCKRIYLTRVPQVVEADTYFRIDDKMNADTENEYKGWKLTARETHFDPSHLIFEIWEHQ